MSELRDRLEALANRGTRRGADDVLSAAQRDAQTISAEDDTADLDGTDLPIIDDDLPLVSLEVGSPRRRRFSSFVASAGIAALVGVGALAVTAMFGSGGAGSPEGAVRQLADSIGNKDPLAAVDVLVPSEVRSMRESVNHLTERAAQLKIVDEASKPLAGVDLSVDHLELRTEPLADGYAKVVITGGEISAGTHRAQLSALLQKAWRNGEDGQSTSDLAKLAGSDDNLPTFVVVVRQGGGWYVSPAYTALEYAREVDDGAPADFGSANPAALGADSPEAAVRDALHAWQAGDWDRLMALAPPDELPVYDYRAWIGQAAADTHPDFTIDKFSTTATVNGDSAVVKLDASGVFGSDPVQQWQVGGTCPPNPGGWFGYTDSYDSSSSSSPVSTPELCLAGDLGQAVPFGLVSAGLLTGSAATSGPVSIEVVRENGRWFVSPVTTALDLIDSSIEHIDERTVYTLFGLAYELPPDGTIALDQPFEVATTSQSILASRVYAFEGAAGQDVIGEMSPVGNGTETSYSYGRLYTADGDEIGEVEFQGVPTGGGEGYGYARSIRLPKTGSYRLVLESWGTDPVTLTLWELAHAPQKLRDAARSTDYPGVGGMVCSTSGTPLLGQSETCTATATTRPVTGPSSSSGGASAPAPSTTASTPTPAPLNGVTETTSP